MKNAHARYLTLGLLAALAWSAGCKGKPKVVDPPQQVIEMESEGESVAEQKEKFKKSQIENAPLPWGDKVKRIADEVIASVQPCFDKYLSKLDPGALLAGKLALPVEGGMVSEASKICRPAIDLLRAGKRILTGQHPKAEEMLRYWTLYTDLELRAFAISTNIASTSKRRQINHGALELIKEELTSTVVPKLLAIAKDLQSFTAATKPQPAPVYEPMGKAEASQHWQDRITATVADLEGLTKEWMTRGYEMQMKDLFPRRRYLEWLGGFWKRRVANDKKALKRGVSSSKKYNAKLREALDPFFEALDTHFQEGWDVAMAAFADTDTIDEGKLKEGKKALDKSYKKLKKAARKVKLPKT